MAYIGKSPDGTGVRSRFYYTQTSGGGTSVTGSSDDGTSLAFSDGAYVDVFLNGVLLVAGTDYNTSTANTIAGLAALANGDVVEVVVYDIFTVADTVSSLNGGTFSGAVGFSGGITGDVAFDTNTLKVDSANNRLGISEASPETKLHLTDHSANAGPVIRLEGNSQNTAGNLLGGIECFNADSSGDGPNVVSAIKFLAHSAIDHGGQITFSTHDGTEGGEGSAPVERARINQDGNLLLGTSSDIEAGARLQVKYTYTNPGAAWESNSTAVHNAIMFRNPNGAIGTIQTTGSSTQYNTSSDYRLKENVVDMTGAIARLKALAPKRFNFIADDTVTVDGFLAHEAQAVVPEAVSGTKDEVDDDGNAVMQGIDHSKLVPLLTGALREAIAKIETLETKVAALESGS